MVKMVRCTKWSSGICDYCNEYDTDCIVLNAIIVISVMTVTMKIIFLEDKNNKMYCLEGNTAWIGICYAQCHPSALWIKLKSCRNIFSVFHLLHI